jgi:hypothetical protein
MAWRRQARTRLKSLLFDRSNDGPRKLAVFFQPPVGSAIQVTDARVVSF